MQKIHFIKLSGIAIMLCALLFMGSCKKKIFNGNNTMFGTVKFQNQLECGTAQIAPAALIILDAKEDDPYETTVDSSGEYRLVSLNDNADVTFRFEQSFGDITLVYSLNTTPKDDQVDPILKLNTDQGNGLVVTVTDSAQNPLANCDVCVYRNGIPANTTDRTCPGGMANTTNACGSTIFDATVPGDYEIVAFPPEGLFANTISQGSVSVNGGTYVASLSLALSAPGTGFSITAQNSTGAYLNGAKVCLYNDADDIQLDANCQCINEVIGGSTDTDGTYTNNTIAPGRYFMWVTHENSNQVPYISSTYKQVDVSGGSVSAYDVTLIPRVTNMEVTVSTPNGQPVSEAHVGLYTNHYLLVTEAFLDTSNMINWSSAIVGITGVNGKVLFEDVPFVPGNYFLKAYKSSGLFSDTTLSGATVSPAVIQYKDNLATIVVSP